MDRAPSCPLEVVHCSRSQAKVSSWRSADEYHSMGQHLRYELPCSSLNYLSHLMLIWPFLVLHTFVLYTSVGCIITAETEADEW